MNPSLYSAEGLAGLLFLVFVACAVAGALVATNSRRLIRAVAGLALSFVGVAGLYFFLGSPFVALMQVLIYVGAVCVTIIFAIMLAEPEEPSGSESSGVKARTALGAAVGIILVWALLEVSLDAEWTGISGKGWDQSLASVKSIGESFLTTYSLNFELISVVLFAAIIGSLVLARAGRNKS